jgi:hypothetical protein
MKSKVLLSLSAFFLLALAAWGDTLVLKNGRSYTGTYMGGTARRITMNLDQGGRRDFNVDEIQSIQFGSGPYTGNSYGRDERNYRYRGDAEQNRDGNQGYYRNDRNQYPDRGGSPNGGDPIRDKYNSLGTSFLGEPVSQVQPTQDGVGRFQNFRNGSIYWSPNTGAHEIHGGIRDEWMRNGAERGPLGYPVTDEQPAPNGDHIQQFQNGSIYWNQSAGARVRVNR